MWASIIFAIAASNSMSQPSFATAQQVCSCSPTIYKWNLDFANSCTNDNIGIDIGPGLGVSAALCEVNILDSTSPDDTLVQASTVPFSVTGFQFLELDEEFQVIKATVSGPPDFIPLSDGGVLEYTSETAAGTRIPVALSATVFATNSQGKDIQLQWLVRFSNLCETIPFKDGDSLGWLVFVSRMQWAVRHSTVRHRV